MHTKSATKRLNKKINKHPKNTRLDLAQRSLDLAQRELDLERRENLVEVGKLEEQPRLQDPDQLEQPYWS